MNLRLQTALTVAVLTTLALGGAFAGVSAAFNGMQRRQLDVSLRSVAAQEAEEAPSHGFAFSDGPGPAANDVGPLTKYGIIFDEQGRVLSATAPFDVAPPARRNLSKPLGAAFDLRFQGSHFRGVLVAIPRHPGKVLFLAASRDDLDGDEAFLFRAMLVAFLVAVAWVAAVAYWMGGRLTRAHHAVADVARQVTEGDLSARVRVRSGDPEVEQLGRDINGIVDRLGTLLASQERFVAHAAHELRSPLAALYGELQQALRKDRDAEGYRGAIEAALVATRRLNVLAEDLLTLARTRASGSMPHESVAVDIAVSEARSVVEQLARSRNVTLETELDAAGAIPYRNGDTARLLRNLLENAVRCSPENGVVRLRARRQDGKVEIAVCDDGPGVAEGDREAIFEPFSHAKGTAPIGGAGLGLAIAREIARAHGGDLVLDHSGPERRGARFVVSFPAAG